MGIYRCPDANANTSDLEMNIIHRKFINNQTTSNMASYFSSTVQSSPVQPFGDAFQTPKSRASSPSFLHLHQDTSLGKILLDYF